ncbi:MAG: short chain dehydrogenase [Firmicutes bacterium]|nr:short chain dehydrogenase [Bacillota bacterium]
MTNLTGNVISSDDMENAFKILINKVRKINILINDAGIIMDRTIKTTTKDVWEYFIDVNLNHFNISQPVINYENI